MLYFAFDPTHIFTFHSGRARDAYCAQVDKNVKPLGTRQRYQLNTRGQAVYNLFNEHCGVYSVMGYTTEREKQKGRRYSRRP